jgi:PLP dependent protein
MSRETFKINLLRVRQRIEAAETRSGRPAGSVRLVGVTKYVDAATTGELAEAGCWELGENRPQSLWEKASTLNDPRIAWHLIGHLQRNKVARTVEVAALIHSVDSERLLAAINEAALRINIRSNVLLEINVSGEAAKHGLHPNELRAILEQAVHYSHVNICGLMCMAGLESETDQTRREFAMLRKLREGHRPFESTNIRLDELSMGMSGDFEIAIEEGATIVRVGSLLFQA